MMFLKSLKILIRKQNQLLKHFKSIKLILQGEGSLWIEIILSSQWQKTRFYADVTFVGTKILMQIMITTLPTSKNIATMKMRSGNRVLPCASSNFTNSVSRKPSYLSPQINLLKNCHVTWSQHCFHPIIPFDIVSLVLSLSSDYWNLFLYLIILIFHLLYPIVKYNPLFMISVIYFR